MRSVLLAALLALATGCTQEFKPWTYEPVSKKGELDDLKPLRVAVVPCAEGRTDDIPGVGNVFIMMVPLVPWWTVESDMTDAGETRFWAERGWPANMGWCEKTTHDLASELRATGSFDAVDVDPSSLDDYDVVLRPTLTSSQCESTTIFYGLTIIGDIAFLPFPIPVGRTTDHWDVRTDVADAAGAKLATIEAKGIEKNWFSFWYLHWIKTDQDERKLAAMQSCFHETATTLVSKLRETVGADPDATARARKQRYFERLDPEVVKFREALASSSTSPDLKRRLARFYSVKTGLLEAERLVERAMIEKEIELRKNAHEAHLKADAEVNHATSVAKRDEVVQQLQASLQVAVVTLGSVQQLQQIGPAPASGAQRAAYALQSAQIVASNMQSIASAVADAQAQQEQTHAALEKMRQTIDAELAAQLEEMLKPFLQIVGDRKGVREQWLSKYRELTPSFEEASQGRWPRAK